MDTAFDHNPPLSRHRISPAELDRFASGEHDTGMLTTLSNAENSRRLLALRLLVHQARKHPSATGPLATVDEAWSLLIRAQREGPHVVSDMLSRPQVGVWCAHTLRRFRGKSEDPAPLWFHVGQLHTFTCAAAIRTGLDFRMTIPLWDGWVVLPDIGSIRLPDATRWATAEVVADAHGARIETRTAVVDLVSQRHTPVSRLQPPHVLSGGCEPVDLAVHLDDVGPYRGLEIPTPAEPLPTAAITRWTTLLVDAWQLLLRDHEPRARELSVGLSVITPRPAGLRFRPHSASVGDGFGEAIIAEPYDATQLAVTMVHEFQHSKLNAINHLVPLVHQDPRAERYSPWRDDPRPTMGLLHGAYAFAAVGEFWATHSSSTTGRERESALFECALRRLQLNTALAELASAQSLTPAGHRVVERITSRVAGWHTGEIPREVAEMARIAALDHRLAWRVSHLRPKRDVVRRAAEAWLRANPPTAIDHTVRVQPDGRSRRLDGKALLAKVLIADPGRSQIRGNHVVAEAGEADLALVTGNPAGARELYLAELSDGSDRPGAWAGLGIAASAATAGQAGAMLLRHPEIVSAVHREVVAVSGEAPHPEELATWLGSPV